LEKLKKILEKLIKLALELFFPQFLHKNIAKILPGKKKLITTTQPILFYFHHKKPKEDRYYTPLISVCVASSYDHKIRTYLMPLRSDAFMRE
jgi:hypothetical protein